MGKVLLVCYPASPGNGEYFGLGGSSGTPDNVLEGEDWKIQTAGTFSKLRAFCSAGGSTSHTITLKKNDVATALTATDTTTAGGWFADDSNTVAAVADDKWVWQATDSGSDPTYAPVTCQFEATSDTVMVEMSSDSQNGGVHDSTSNRYLRIGGGCPPDGQAEGAAAFRIGHACTKKFLQVDAAANAGSAVTRVFKSFKNGAEGNQSVSFVDGETGKKIDTSNSDSVAVDDIFSIEIEPQGATDDITTHSYGVESVSTANFFDILGGGGTASSAWVIHTAGTTSYYSVGGLLRGVGGTGVHLPFACTVSKLRAYITNNSWVGTVTASVQKDTGGGFSDTTQTLAMTGSDSGWVETSGDAATFDADDYLLTQFTGGTSGATRVRMIAITVEDTSAGGGGRIMSSLAGGGGLAGPGGIAGIHGGLAG